MKIFPAMDLLGGKVVRLHQGRFDQVTMYSDDPLTVARLWVEQGASRLHVVDLDGSRDGVATHAEVIHRILAEVGKKLTVQVGGGIRTVQQIEGYLSVGVSRVVLGTAAVRNPRFVEQACKKYKIVVAVDAVDGWVQTSGWTEGTGVSAESLAKTAVEMGAAGVLYTDIRRDGTGAGPDLDRTLAMVKVLPGVDVIASGGVGTLDDLQRLADGNVPSVVVGRALYDKKFTLSDAIRVGGEQ